LTGLSGFWKVKEENATLKKALAESVVETMKYKKSLGM
jgi:hypothetical protein